MSKEVLTEYVGNQESELTPNVRWWKRDNADIYKSVWKVVDNIELNQSFLRAAFARYAAMYSNMEFLGLSSRLFSRTALNSFFNNRLSLNVIKSCIDSVSSKIAKNRPRPLFLTSDGDESQQRRAKQLTKYLDGTFEEINAYELGQRAFVDSCVFGIGILKVFIEDSKIKVERIFAEELTVDEADAVYGTPSQIHQTKYISRDVLIEMFPEYEAKIRSANSFVRADMAYRSASDQIAVRESWHLKSGANATDGKHAITIDNCTLFAEKYDKDYFPFVFMKWNPRIYGFFGMGLAEELVGIQLEINKILLNIQRAIQLIGVPRVYVQNGSDVNTSMFNNEIGAIYKYTGTPPIVSTPPSIGQDVFGHLENLYRKAYEITGVSLLSATSQKPTGIDSAVAMREYQDIESERFMLVAQRYEKAYLDLAKIIIDLSKDLYTKEVDVKVKVKSGKFLESIKWSDVNMEDDDYIMQVFPTSLLPNQPQGRLAHIQELVQSGFMQKEDALSLLDFPDLEGFVNLQTASREDIQRIIENMLNGKYETPEPYMNLDLALKMVQSSYLKARVNKVSDEKLDLMRRYMDELFNMKQKAQIQAMPPVQTGAPMPPPQSELIPNAPMVGA